MSPCFHHAFRGISTSDAFQQVPRLGLIRSRPSSSLRCVCCNYDFYNSCQPIRAHDFIFVIYILGKQLHGLVDRNTVVKELRLADTSLSLNVRSFLFLTVQDNVPTFFLFQTIYTFYCACVCFLFFFLIRKLFSYLQ